MAGKTVHILKKDPFNNTVQIKEGKVWFTSECFDSIVKFKAKKMPVKPSNPPPKAPKKPPPVKPAMKALWSKPTRVLDQRVCFGDLYGVITRVRLGDLHFYASEIKALLVFLPNKDDPFF
jgi:hypothetical protein